MTEIETKLIPGFSSYTVSADGKVFNRHGRRLSGYLNGGYHQIKLRDDGGTPRAAMVHRLVVAAFIAPIPAGMWVNHKNGIKDDNRVENLEITTPQENMAHMFEVLQRSCVKIGTANGRAKLSLEDVRMVHRLGAEGNSQKAIAERFGVSQCCVNFILTGRRWKKALTANPPR